MLDDTDSDQMEGRTLLFTELFQLFEQAQELQTQSTQLLALAHQEPSIVHREAVRPETTAPIETPHSSEETLDRIIALLASCSFETQVAIMKTLALRIAKIARARTEVKNPLAA